MITVPQATVPSVLTAINTAPLAGETMDSIADMSSTDVEADMAGIGLRPTTTE
jgi:hypothetical protein